MRQVPGAPCVAILFSLRRAAAEGLAGRVVRPMQAGLGSLAFREPWGAPFAPWQAFDLAGAVLADLFLARALLRGGGNPGPDYR